MTSQDHNRALGILNLVYGAIHAPLLLVVVVLLFAGLGFALPELGALQGTVLFGIAALVLFFVAIFTVVPLVAGYGLLKGKPWARTAGIISGIMSAINFPLGTALCTYSLWYLFSDEARRLYGGRAPDERRSALDGASSSARQYMPPPDWRGQ